MMIYAFTVSFLTVFFIAYSALYGTLVVLMATTPSLIASVVMWLDGQDCSGPVQDSMKAISHHFFIPAASNVQIASLNQSVVVQ
jgi:hypothetical protein